MGLVEIERRKGVDDPKPYARQAHSISMTIALDEEQSQAFNRLFIDYYTSLARFSLGILSAPRILQPSLKASSIGFIWLMAFASYIDKGPAHYYFCD